MALAQMSMIPRSAPALIFLRMAWVTGSAERSLSYKLMTILLPRAAHNRVPLDSEVEAEAGGIATRRDDGGIQGPHAPATNRVERQQRVLCSRRSIELPVELWWKVIDFIADGIPRWENGRIRMRELARVSRVWYTRCRFRAEERLDIIERNKKEVYWLIGRLNEYPERYDAIKKVHFENDKINTFGSFVICMAGRLTQVETLELSSHSSGSCDWDPGQLHTQVFLHVRIAFESVTTLGLIWVSFPSAVVFGRLLYSLPCLASLTCNYVTFKKRGILLGTVSSPLRLATVDLVNSRDVVDFLVITRAGASLRHIAACHDQDREACSRLIRVAAFSLSSLLFSVHSGRNPNKSDDLLPDLTPAYNLRSLSIELGPAFDSQQLAAALPRAYLPNLREMEITILWFSDNLKFKYFDDDSYAHIDRVLSGPRFPALRKVTWHPRCRITRSKVADVTSEVSWREHLSSKLPLLHASGRLLVSLSVDVDNEDKFSSRTF
ncbi:uncharacterized protein FIBRA_08665 [Fibroporia radiculosa]|uniref:F-box domain-containing protein n=1 Tax=Fibroporia radiculosa TaxID=599839 RepID=J4H5A6_9APHY|nr:uncharacterized protein FIBRA_08665 [Fibroporia radiculosa]CCM06404.1 predicted protein [Fibroporia radiculosa]